MKKTVILTTALLLLTSVAVLTVSGEPAIIQPDISDPDIIEMIDHVTEPMVHTYHDTLMLFGPRYTGSVNCELAAQYIYDEFAGMRLDVEFHNWTFDTFESQNVVATLHGSDPSSNAVIIMSAHYDCTPGSLGADDDASGVAAILAAATIMSNYTFNHTIRFVAFSGEEVGTYGSFSYARDAAQRGDNILAVINLDMIGYANTTEGGNIIRMFTPGRAHWIPEFATTVSEKYITQTELTVEAIPNYIGADHQAFIDFGYDAVFVAHYDSYPWGNTPEDTPDHLNWTYEVKATKFSLALVATLARAHLPLHVMFTRPYEGYGYLFDHPLLPLACGKGWYRGTRGMTVLLGRATATAEVFTTEELERVVFCIDGNFIAWDYEPPYEWKIQGKHGPPVGKHTLKVYAYTTNGSVATDEMDMFIVTLSCQYCRW